MTDLIDKSDKALPTAHPEKRTNERTETHARDCISRQAAIGELYKMLHDCFWADDEELDAVITTLNDLPSAQPDMSEYSDKLWKAAYERGKAEAQPDLDEVYAHAETEAEARYHAEIVRCKDCNHWSRESICDGFCSEDCMRHDEDFYCGYAERKTNE